ncbi:unnamed protein product [Spirodela intermedia]|uniref:Uncharacterized protein n=1 Tax=Spirodela intermedia TaxID=51605 RepID=A0A7I8LD37_SPIIN|nr:unnamed protein product [Spirodela intermedia]
MAVAVAVAVAAASGATKGSLAVLLTVLVLGVFSGTAGAKDTNNLYQPCGDTTVRRLDGFTLGIASAPQTEFVFNRTMLSPCDRRLALSSVGAKLAVFRPKVDEISLLTISNNNGIDTVSSGWYMVAFAGRKYAARSPTEFIGNVSFVITSFTLVLEFEKGRLQNLFWKRDGCSRCSSRSSQSRVVCLGSLGCGIRRSRCKSNITSSERDTDCTISIQLAFSGTDKHYTALNSWYEVSKLRQYSLYALYSNLKDSVSSQLGQFFP